MRSPTASPTARTLRDGRPAKAPLDTSDHEVWRDGGWKTGALGDMGTGAEVVLVPSGSTANLLLLTLACSRSVHSAYCARDAHVNVSETGCVEGVAGRKLHAVRCDPVSGKLDVQQLREAAAAERAGGVFTTLPRCISVTQPTEAGAVYQPEELDELRRAADEFGMLLHIDGARLHAAAHRSGVAAAIRGSRCCGPDLLSFGGTKNGMMIGEAAVVLNGQSPAGSALAAEGAVVQRTAKQLGAVVSKHRFLAAQWVGYLRDDAWLRHARRGAEQAVRLASRLRERSIPGFTVRDPETNLVFVDMPAAVHAALQAHFLCYEWAQPAAGFVTVRVCCGWDTTEADVDAFVEAAAVAAAEHGGDRRVSPPLG
eukprot:TRINITY_DN13382_c0_g1_i6.p1 TRINITY_DN13382_c0_g1~~TRINITY_DN13382_c0_g1_i6.p1  ORF type:complete len:369 (+),score=70.80 TRINITY_DN13382_c0_g1_i6:266-1372(+)